MKYDTHRHKEEVQDHTSVKNYLKHHYYDINIYGSDFEDISQTGVVSSTSFIDDDIHFIT